MSAVSNAAEMPTVQPPGSKKAASLDHATSRLWPTVATIIGIGLIAIALQVHFGAFGDVSWLLTVGEGWLDGKTPYVDIIETNPPAAILIYMPAVALARALGARSEFVVVVYGLFLTLGSLLLSAAILSRAGPRARPGTLSLGVALVALTILPGRTFDERDFFAVLLGLPFVAVWIARASRAPVNLGATLVSGLGAGAMIAMKPPYALVVLALAPYLLAKTGWRGLFASIESYVAAALSIGYAALVVSCFPAYLEDVWPTIATAYLPVRESIPHLLANAGLVLWVSIVSLTGALAGRRALEPMIAMPALGSLGAVAAFFVQGKGWLYHLYPALALAALAMGAALDLSPRAPGEIATGAAVALVTLGLSVAFGVPAIPLAIGLTLAARFLVPGRGSEESLGRLAILACGGLIGAACGLYGSPFPGPTEEFTRALSSLGPHPRVAAISEGLGAGFPLVRNVGGVWVQRTQGLLMTSGARYLMDSHPDDRALAARLEPIIGRDRDMVAEDIARNRPDAILIGRKGTRFYDWAMNDPELKAARAGYRLMAENAGKDWPIELYVRADLIGLRPAPASEDASR